MLNRLGWPATLSLPTQTGIAAALAAGLGAAFSAGSDSGLVPTTNWRPFTNPNTGGATNAYDRNPSTRWSSDTFQVPGMYYGLDIHDHPDHLGLVVVGRRLPPRSGCAGLLQQPRLHDGAEHSQHVQLHRQRVLTVTLDPVSARYLKLTGSAPGNYLSVHELYLYGTAES